MPLSQFDKENLTIIIGGHGSWFTAQLMWLIASADPVNIERLRISFPDEVAAFEQWLHADSRPAEVLRSMPPSEACAR